MKKVIALSTLMTASFGALATAEDPVDTAVQAGVSTITGGIPQIAAVGGALIGLAAVAVVIKWVKASFFG